MLNDSNHGVGEAEISCIEEIYTQVGPQFRDELRRHHLPLSVASTMEESLKDINAKLERIEPKVHSSDGIASSYTDVEIKPASLNSKRVILRPKTTLEAPPINSAMKKAYPAASKNPWHQKRESKQPEATNKRRDNANTEAKHLSNKLLIIEGLVIGGAGDYPCFRGLLKQLVGPSSTQLSDQRSTIVKQGTQHRIFGGQISQI